MRVTRAQLAFAFALAALVHIAAAAALFWVPPPSGARAVGLGGVAVSLGPSGGAPGNAAMPVPRGPEVPAAELAYAQEVQTVDVPAERLLQERPPETTRGVEPDVVVPVETTHEAANAWPNPLLEEVQVESLPPVKPEVAHAVDTPEQQTVAAVRAPVEQLAQEVRTETPELIEPDAAVPIEAAIAPPPPVKTMPPEAAAQAKPAPRAPRPHRKRQVRAPKRIEARPTPAPAPAKVAPAAGPSRKSTASASPSTAGTLGKAGSKKSTASGSTSASSGGGSPGASADYLSYLLAWLQKHKEYPREAQRRRLEGTALLYFEMDRQGRVQTSQLQRSSGHASLDAEVQALLRRAEPLPVPPAEIQGERIKLIVPVQFFLR